MIFTCGEICSVASEKPAKYAIYYLFIHILQQLTSYIFTFLKQAFDESLDFCNRS